MDLVKFGRRAQIASTYPRQYIQPPPYGTESPVLSRDFLDCRIGELDSYISEFSAAGVYPFAVVESNSFQGSVLEAENQCAESLIKMLFKLRQLGAGTTDLPVVTIALVGSELVLKL